MSTFVTGASHLGYLAAGGIKSKENLLLREDTPEKDTATHSESSRLREKRGQAPFIGKEEGRNFYYM